MITTSNTVAIAAGTIVRYAAPSIRVVPTYSADQTQVSCILQVLDGTNVIADVLVQFTPAALDATVQAASGYVAKFQGASEKVAKDYLEGLAANSGATFTIV
jgi:hypothetical protein